MGNSDSDLTPEHEVKKEEHEVGKKAEDILLKVRDRGGRTLEFRVRET